MASNEAVVIIGSEQFSTYKGYGEGFEFEGDYIDTIQLDFQNRNNVIVLAIDALNFYNFHKIA